MKKMKTLFVKDYAHRATKEIQCEWAFDDGVTVHIKHDGSACMIKGGVLYKRYDAKKNKKTGQYKTPPDGAIECCPPDDKTGHWPHWVECNKSDKYHMVAFSRMVDLPDGTYELVGPKVNGNNSNYSEHELIDHNRCLVSFNCKTYEECERFLQGFRQEGLVFHHPDGRMCKLRRRDFGFDWPIRSK